MPVSGLALLSTIASLYRKVCICVIGGVPTYRFVEHFSAINSGKEE